MHTVSRDFHFCYGHRLLGHAGRCVHLHGHNVTARVTLQASSLNPLGMVVDFGDLKQSVGAWIDTTLDHKMLLSEADPLLPLLQRAGEQVVVLTSNPTAENISRLIFEKVAALGFPVIEVTLWETPNCSATYTANSSDD